MSRDGAIEPEPPRTLVDAQVALALIRPRREAPLGECLRITSDRRGGMRRSPRLIGVTITKRYIWRSRSESMRRKWRRRSTLVWA